MRSINNIAEELFDKIRSRVSSIKLGDTNGMQTTDSSQARFFEFQFKHKDLPIGAVTLSLNEEGTLQVYFPNSIVEDADSDTADAWYGFLKELSKFSARNMLNYETHNVTKERLDKKDYQFLTQRSQDEVMENKMYGSSQKSFLEQGTAKIIIQHNKTVDETKMGARSRNISAIYIENSDGERFKFANNYLPGARAMARHVSNEGHTRDDRGKHIVEIMTEMQNLKTFVRAIKREDYVTEEQNEIIEAATDRYYGLKDTLKTLASANGYSEYFENWSPEEVQEEGDLEDLKLKLTREVYDERLTNSLPSVRKAMEQRRQVKEADMKDLIDFANSDDNIEVFNNPADMAELKNYMQFMKNSDMDTSRKNRSILVAIMKYLANNMTNDKAANALSDIELDDPAQQKMAFQIAKKYLQGKVDVKEPKAKKDLFGKDKTEGVTFESYEESMNMIAEGTWALPENESDAMGLARLMEKPLPLGDAGEDATAAVGAFIGDDELYDDLGEAGDKDPNADARPIIMGWLMDHVDDYGPKFQKSMQMALDQINKTGPDQTKMVIPRRFGRPRFEDVELIDEGYEKMVINALKDAGISHDGFRNGFLYIDRDDMKAARKAIKDADIDPPKMIAEGEDLEEGKMKDLMMHIEDMIRDGSSNEEIKKMHPMVSDSDIERMRREMDESVQEADIDLPGGGTIKDVDKPGIYKGTQKADGSYVGGEGGEAMAMSNKILDKIEMEDPATDKEARELFMKYASGQDKMVKRLVMKELKRMGFFESKEAVEESQEADEVAESIAKMKAMAGVGSNMRSNHGIHEGEPGYQITPRSIVARQLRKLQDLEK